MATTDSATGAPTPEPRARTAERALLLAQVADDPRLSGILQSIEIPITLLGYSEREVAARLGVRLGIVRGCRSELRAALYADRS